LIAADAFSVIGFEITILENFIEGKDELMLRRPCCREQGEGCPGQKDMLRCTEPSLHEPCFHTNKTGNESDSNLMNFI
jgi:hypothetical protein